MMIVGIAVGWRLAGQGMGGGSLVVGLAGGKDIGLGCGLGSGVVGLCGRELGRGEARRGRGWWWGNWKARRIQVHQE